MKEMPYGSKVPPPQGQALGLFPEDRLSQKLPFGRLPMPLSQDRVLNVKPVKEKKNNTLKTKIWFARILKKKKTFL